ncbi:MAG: hypothetical protein M3162_02625 [Thermoproteota archaeon]|nr:hypothetical protein [Thermoproteota archaeon]
MNTGIRKQGKGEIYDLFGKKLQTDNRTKQNSTSTKNDNNKIIWYPQDKYRD